MTSCLVTIMKATTLLEVSEELNVLVMEQVGCMRGTDS